MKNLSAIITGLTVALVALSVNAAEPVVTTESTETVIKSEEVKDKDVNGKKKVEVKKEEVIKEEKK